MNCDTDKAHQTTMPIAAAVVPRRRGMLPGVRLYAATAASNPAKNQTALPRYVCAKASPICEAGSPRAYVTATGRSNTAHHEPEQGEDREASPRQAMERPCDEATRTRGGKPRTRVRPFPLPCNGVGDSCQGLPPPESAVPATSGSVAPRRPGGRRDPTKPVDRVPSRCQGREPGSRGAGQGDRGRIASSIFALSDEIGASDRPIDLIARTSTA